MCLCVEEGDQLCLVGLVHMLTLLCTYVVSFPSIDIICCSVCGKVGLEGGGAVSTDWPWQLEGLLSKWCMMLYCTLSLLLRN